MEEACEAARATAERALLVSGLSPIARRRFSVSSDSGPARGEAETQPLVSHFLKPAATGSMVELQCHRLWPGGVRPRLGPVPHFLKPAARFSMMVAHHRGTEPGTDQASRTSAPGRKEA